VGIPEVAALGRKRFIPASSNRDVVAGKLALAAARAHMHGVSNTCSAPRSERKPPGLAPLGFAAAGSGATAAPRIAPRGQVSAGTTTAGNLAKHSGTYSDAGTGYLIFQRSNVLQRKMY
jgi:hypothetical protein